MPGFSETKCSDASGSHKHRSSVNFRGGHDIFARKINKMQEFFHDSSQKISKMSKVL